MVFAILYCFYKTEIIPSVFYSNSISQLIFTYSYFHYQYSSLCFTLIHLFYLKKKYLKKIKKILNYNQLSQVITYQKTT
ncbi:hypothetical protein EGH73_00540 [Epilithonimonas hominis]|uniref:Transmembrane protein n=1 Tax=Epilithonimonas hominis TaxID=420404 RepID=A0A3N0XC00_9FLAO|nr:hypothetical protein EGH73_00540 [Epilithonimonas hominis]